jgi:hypothetical protein
MRTWLILAALLSARPSAAAPEPDNPAEVAPAVPAPPEHPAAVETPKEASEARCKKALEARDVSVKSDQCWRLAAIVVASVHERAITDVQRITTDVQRAIELGAGQPRITDTPGAQTSFGQTAAVASGQPVATGGGSIAIGDTGQGLQLVTALALNPAAIALEDTSKYAVWASRLIDLSLILPLELKPADVAKNGFQYIGGRFRLNAMVAFRSPQLMRTVAAFQSLKPAFLNLEKTVEELLQKSEYPEYCANAIIEGSRDVQLMSCGKAVNVSQFVKTSEDVRAQLARFREDTDRKYLSLEGRFDRGDLNEDGAAAKDSLVAAYVSTGYGGDTRTDGTKLEFRARGGFVFFHDGATDRSRSAAYGAFGVELAMVRDLRRYCLSAALELTRQWGGDALPAMPSVMVPGALRLGLGVPLADGRTVSVGVVLPTGDGKPTLAISGDWSLLFGR